MTSQISGARPLTPSQKRLSGRQKTITTRLAITCALAFASVFANAVEEGDLAPNFTLPSIYDGKPTIDLASLRGKNSVCRFLGLLVCTLSAFDARLQ